MRTSWRRAGSGDRYAVPVEMRFIDLFMAALGALCFMAMLFAFQMRFLKGPTSAFGNTAKSSPTLQLLTKSLPSGRVNEPYEIAFAYRGGDGAVSWEIQSGAQESQAGMKFDAERGMLIGTPSRTGKIRFVLIARDDAGQSQERPYELAVEPARADSAQIKKWFAIVTLVVIGLLWLRSLRATLACKQNVRQLEAAAAQGLTEVHGSGGRGTKLVIQLPDGIDTYKGHLRSARGMSWFLLLVLLALGTWFYFSLASK